MNWRSFASVHTQTTFVPHLIALLIFLPVILGSPHQIVVQSAHQLTTIYDIQYTEDPSGDSPFEGQSVTLYGFVTGTFVDGFVVAETPGAWHSVYVYTRKEMPDIGDEVEFSGVVYEHFGMTEIINISNYHLISTGNQPVSTVLDVNDAGNEAYESVLVEIGPVVVMSLEDYGEWIVSDDTGSIRCDDLNDYVYFPQVGDQLETITGNLFYSYGDFKIEPRYTSDITGSVIPHYAISGTIVTMNDDLEILIDGYIEIHGDRILSVDSIPPTDVPLIPDIGMIFPGLIDAHNHPNYNVLDEIPFKRNFDNRYEWQIDPLYPEFKEQFNNIQHHGGTNNQRINLFKYAEVRALASGTTTIQGFNANGHEYDGFAHQGVVINNAERFPNLIYSSVFPLNQSASFWQVKKSEYWHKFLIHLSEGVDQSALEEFYAWVNLVGLDHRTTIIHGIPYREPEWLQMSSASASLIWSPTSNMKLYGETAQILGALDAEVNVALAPDWTESGALNILMELKAAKTINQDHWNGAISDQQLVEFVTRNAAIALGIQDRVGQITPGYQADLMVITEDGLDPYSKIISTHPSQVRLTIVNGRPLYGDPDLMGRFPFLPTLEYFQISGVIKQLAIQLGSHTIPEADTPFSEVYSTLLEAYQEAEPKICNFMDIDHVMATSIYLPLIPYTK